MSLINKRKQVLVMDSKNWKAMVSEMCALLGDEKGQEALAIVAKHQKFEDRSRNAPNGGAAYIHKGAVVHF